MGAGATGTAELDPALARVIESIPAWAGLEPRITPLTAGITNRNFRVDLGEASYVVRLSGRDTDLLGIDRAAEHAAAVAAAEAGVGPEVVAFLPELEALVTRFVEGDALPEADLERADVIASVVSSVRAIHAMAPIPSTFDAFRVVREYRRTAEDRGVPIPAAYRDALVHADEIQRRFRWAPQPERPCHNDLLNANFIVAGDRVVIVDYEYAGVGDPFFDLGNFSINNGLSEDAQGALLEAYFGRVTPRVEARLKLMRIMSDFREAMWGVVQQGLSALDVDFVEYADRHFARCLGGADDERFGAWLRDAAAEA